MSLTIATRADIRPAAFDRFVSMSIDIVNSTPSMPGNLGVRFTNRDLAWFTLTAWSDEAALDGFLRSERHRRAVEAVDQLTRATAFARLDGDQPFHSIEWDFVIDLLATD
jgi:quinol monooxygenase YgiN